MRLYELLSDTVRRFPDSVAMNTEKRTLTFSSLLSEIDRVARSLWESGIRPGDRVGLCRGEKDLWFVFFCALLRLGAVAVLFSDRLRGESLEALRAYTSPRFFLSEEDLKTLSGISPRSSEALRIPLPDPDVPAVMLFTSGTSALPKAVMLSQNNLTLSVLHILPRCLPPGASGYLAALPLYHCYGLVSSLSYLCGGCTLYLPENLRSETLAELIFAHRIPIIGSVGVVYSRLSEVPDFDRRVAPFVRLCVIGGEFSSPEFLQKLEEFFPHAAVYNGYGQTECSPYIAVPRYDDPPEVRYFTVGRPMEGTELRIISPDGRILPPGNAGEVLTRGYHVMLGYYSDLWAQPMDSEGFLHTGDLGYLDEKGCLRLLGRIKDIIIRNGENISPEEVERALLSLPGVAEASVVGLPHPETGECVCACLVMAQGVVPDGQMLSEKLRCLLEHHKIPTRFCFAKSLPRNALGKVDRKAVAGLFQSTDT